MNNITQNTIFDYQEIEVLGDLERLKYALDNIDADNLIKTLEEQRGNGRNDYPVKVMLNMIIAIKVYGHRSVESFRRELSRNSGLRQICGMKDYENKYYGKHLVPVARVFTNFFKSLVEYQSELKKIFDVLVKYMYDTLPNFGEDTALDGKIIETYGKKNNEKTDDCRSEHDAAWMVKEYHFDDGRVKKKSYFGFEAHIISDANYGLPISYITESANVSELKMAHKLIDELDEYKIEKMKNLMADKGYDDSKLMIKLKDKYDINPIIDIRNNFGSEKLKEIDEKMLSYNKDGEVFYINDICKGDYTKLKYLGYDKQRKCLRYGFYDKEKTDVFRIPLSIDRRVFVPVARDSDKFKKLYKKRTEIERLNGRIDRDYMFNDHFIRGKKKMNMMLSLTFIVMLGMAKGHIINKQSNIRSLVKI
jgi:hypothetical protein